MVNFRFLEIMINLTEFYNKGYTISDNPIFTQTEIFSIKEKLDTIYNTQLEEFGKNKLSTINEEGMIRSLLTYDSYFINLITLNPIQTILQQILGNYYILSLQNAIIVSPSKQHHQSFYHRDIIHQNFTSSKPLGVNVYFCLDDYTPDTGGTTFIPSSHKLDSFPSSFTEETPIVKEGHVLFFDSMVYHKAGSNIGSDFRYGINHMYTLPFIKQQINFPYALQGEYSQDFPLNRILGYHSREFTSVADFRNYRYKRITNE